jgi:hypothetical protein
VATRQRNAWLQQLLSPGRYHGVQAGHGRSATDQQQQQQQQGVRDLFKGLRVRVGVASGYVPKGQELRRSKVYRMAQGERVTMHVLLKYMCRLPQTSGVGTGAEYIIHW